MKALQPCDLQMRIRSLGDKMRWLTLVGQKVLCCVCIHVDISFHLFADKVKIHHVIDKHAGITVCREYVCYLNQRESGRTSDSSRQFMEPSNWRGGSYR